MRIYFVAGILLLVAAVQIIEERHQERATNRHQQVSDQSPPQTLYVDAFPQTSGQSAASEDQSHSADKTSHWEKATAPPTWSNWALVAVGLGATIAALCTLKVIRRQAIETAASARAMEKSVRLQEIQMRQWLKIEGWQEDAGTPFPSISMTRKGLTFNITNPTRSPLDLCLVSIDRDKEKPFDIPAHRTLEPEAVHKVIVPDILPDIRVNAQRTVTIAGVVKYIDTFRTMRDQPFRCMGVCTSEQWEFSTASWAEQNLGKK
jgi:hypothetical protein